MRGCSSATRCRSRKGASVVGLFAAAPLVGLLAAALTLIAWCLPSAGPSVPLAQPLSALSSIGFALAGVFIAVAPSLVRLEPGGIIMDHRIEVCMALVILGAGSFAFHDGKNSRGETDAREFAYLTRGVALAPLGTWGHIVDRISMYSALATITLISALSLFKNAALYVRGCRPDDDGDDDEKVGEEAPRNCERDGGDTSSSMAKRIVEVGILVCVFLLVVCQGSIDSSPFLIATGAASLVCNTVSIGLARARTAPAPRRRGTFVLPIVYFVGQAALIGGAFAMQLKGGECMDLVKAHRDDEPPQTAAFDDATLARIARTGDALHAAWHLYTAPFLTLLALVAVTTLRPSSCGAPPRRSHAASWGVTTLVAGASGIAGHFFVDCKSPPPEEALVAVHVLAFSAFLTAGGLGLLCRNSGGLSVVASSSVRRVIDVRDDDKRVIEIRDELLLQHRL